MSIVVTATAGLVIWIVLWSLNVSGFDGILIAGGMVLIAIGVQGVLPRLASRKEP
jgi:hypothetical protein